jgi:hypothetical protein
LARSLGGDPERFTLQPNEVRSATRAIHVFHVEHLIRPRLRRPSLLRPAKSAASVRTPPTPRRAPDPLLLPGKELQNRLVLSPRPRVGRTCADLRSSISQVGRRARTRLAPAAGHGPSETGSPSTRGREVGCTCADPTSSISQVGRRAPVGHGTSEQAHLPPEAEKPSSPPAPRALVPDTPRHERSGASAIS